jgi:hypothetical protein
MFNANDTHDDPPGSGRHGGLALGHYITRLCCRWIKHWLEQPGHEGYTAADLPGAGAPYGIQFEMTSAIIALFEILYDVHKKKPVNPAQVILDALSVDAKMIPDKDMITLFPGYQPLTPQAAAAIYAELLPYWERTWGDQFTADAIVETDIRSHLEWTIPTLAKAARVVVMGHTHRWAESEPETGILKVPSCLYANCGFNCPTLPQMSAEKPTWPTFVELTYKPSLREYEVTVNQVERSHRVPGRYDIVPAATESISAT